MEALIKLGRKHWLYVTQVQQQQHLAAGRGSATALLVAHLWVPLFSRVGSSLSSLGLVQN
jgi:hypothetical protein